MNVPGMPPSWPGHTVTWTIAVARMGRRLLAFLLDGTILVIASLVAYSIAGMFGVWRIDSEWLSQYTANPDVMPAMPALHVDLNLLFAVSVAIAVSFVFYAAACWSSWGAMPGQRALGLKVLDFDTGRPVSFPSAFLRSLAIYGVLGAMLAAYATLSFERLATVGVNDPTTQLLPPGTPLDPWLDVISGIVFLGALWVLLLLLSSASNRQRRGVHDRMGRSIVVGVQKRAVWSPPYPAYPGYPTAPQPGWTPPGTWSAPGQQGSAIDWQTPPAPGVPGVPGASSPAEPSAPDRPGPSRPADAPTSPDATPWKAGERDESRVSASSETASLARRITAYLIDSTILFMLFIAALQTLAPEGTLNSAALSNERTAILGGLAGGAMQLVYFVLAWTLWKATPGQRIVGIAVVLESDGKAMSAMDAIVRWAVVQGPFALVSIVPLAISPIVFLAAAGWSAFLLYSTRADVNCQGLHDHFLGTKVVATA